MKILLLNHSDIGGGATVAAWRLLKALQTTEVNIELGVIEKYSDNPAVICLKKKYNLADWALKILHKISFYLRNFLFKTVNPVLHSENKDTALDIMKVNNSDCDLVHLHWVNYNTISIEDIAKIRKPLIWTLHDSWVFCGAEHYQNILENDWRFSEGYTQKNKPLTTQGLDICRKTWERKKKAWKNLKCDFISPSDFEKKCFEQSALFRNSENSCVVIPNIVPETIFKPLNRAVLRKKYDMPENKKIIGFGACNISAFRSVKGGRFLLEALTKLENPAEYQLVIFGNVSTDFSTQVASPVFAAGYVKEPEKLAEIYNLCDVYVCPSLIESFGLTCLEAAFCGVPVAAFNTGGIPDIVEHRKTGYLAKSFEIGDLARGIVYCLENKKILSENSLAKARRDFSNQAVLEKHISVYKNVLKCSQEGKR
ncbi:glycosyl transferase GTB-type super family [Candidatus Termititenax aidoneus]|uniref:Glycosyl transferase GTB-type super family n=1 Tax=Termititenax aidoneus TaxID=2218524 RepID=A0A388TCS2_TERA1|nr:glycosyl transferase GTB-type super family [Candidatus Termititenax aidoneus]